MYLGTFRYFAKVNKNKKIQIHACAAARVRTIGASPGGHGLYHLAHEGCSGLFLEGDYYVDARDCSTFRRMSPVVGITERGSVSPGFQVTQKWPSISQKGKIRDPYNVKVVTSLNRAPRHLQYALWGSV